jgi:hypothetical protein
MGKQVAGNAGSAAMSHSKPQHYINLGDDLARVERVNNEHHRPSVGLCIGVSVSVGVKAGARRCPQ